MSNPLFYVEAGGLATTGPGGTVVLTGAEARHAAQSMRLGPGESLDLADGTGRRVTATVVTAAADRLEARAESVTDETAPRPELVLVQALAKGDRDLMGIQAGTELGLDAVHPWQAERSIVRWAGGRPGKSGTPGAAGAAGRSDKTAKAIAKWEAALLAAAKQARRTRVPVVREMLDGVGVRSVCVPGTLVLVLHEEAQASLGEVVEDLARAADRIVMVVGPEGGISPAELTALTEAGAVPVLLGHHVLRSSTAGPAATAVLQQLLGRFGSRS